MKTAAGVPSTKVKWTNQPLGAMGYTTSIQGKTVAGITRMITGTDGAGLFYRDGATGRWTQAFQRGVGLDALFDMKPSIGDSDGCWAAKMAPADLNYVYAHWKHRFVRSRDGCRTWTPCTAIPQMLANSNLQANGSYGRLCYGKMGVDGLLKNVVYWGTLGTGMMVTTDGGDSYSTHADIPVPNHATTEKQYCVIAVDENSAAAGNGRNSVVAVVSMGRGLYVSSNGGVSFALADATVTDVYNIKFAPDGKLWIMLNTTGQNLKTFTIGGALSALFGPTSDVRDVIWDPSDSSTVYTLKFFSKSTSPFTTWSDLSGAVTDPYFVKMVGHEAPLIAEVFQDDHAMISAQGVWFAGKLFLGTGYGPVYIDETNLRTANKTAGPALTMEEDVVGIENIVPQVAHIMPSGRRIVISQDKAAIALPRNGSFPQTCFPTSALVPGFDIDDNGGTYAATLAGLGTPGGLNWSGYTPDDGDTWARFATAPSTFIGGSLAVIRSGEIAICTGNNGWPRWTADNGATWADSVFSGFAKATGSTNGWGFANISNDRRVICNDKENNPDRVFLYNYGQGSGATHGGLWESLDGGRNYTNTYNNSILDPLFVGNHELLRCKQGFLWLSAGVAGSQFDAPAATNTLKRASTSAVTSWSDMPSITEVSFYCFGAPLVPGGYPTLYAYGWIGGVLGLYRCRNANAATIANCVWELMTQHSEFAAVAAIAADPRDGHFGEGIMGFGGMGYRQFSDNDGIAMI